MCRAGRRRVGRQEMRPMRKLFGLAFISASMLVAACSGGDDTAALKAQIAALQSQVAQPTSVATSTPMEPTAAAMSPAAPEQAATAVPPTPAPAPQPAPPPQPQPAPAIRDTVVGVEMLCDEGGKVVTGDGCTHWTYGDELRPPCVPCGHTPVFYASNRRYSLTVRTPAGSTYVVTLAFSIAVGGDVAPTFLPPAPDLGSPWPP